MAAIMCDYVSDDNDYFVTSRGTRLLLYFVILQYSSFKSFNDSTPPGSHAMVWSILVELLLQYVKSTLPGCHPEISDGTIVLVLAHYSSTTSRRLTLDPILICQESGGDILLFKYDDNFKSLWFPFLRVIMTNELIFYQAYLCEKMFTCVP
jgi:hypothetical protein